MSEAAETGQGTKDKRNRLVSDCARRRRGGSCERPAVPRPRFCHRRQETLAPVNNPIKMDRKHTPAPSARCRPTRRQRYYYRRYYCHYRCYRIERDVPTLSHRWLLIAGLLPAVDRNLRAGRRLPVRGPSYSASFVSHNTLEIFIASVEF